MFPYSDIIRELLKVKTSLHYIRHLAKTENETVTYQVGYLVSLVDIIQKSLEEQEMKENPVRMLILSSLEDLCQFFGADDVKGLNNRIYKDTACGASISIQTPEGIWHHNGEDWAGITSIQAFTIQTTVEDSDANIANVFILPCLTKRVEEWIDEMEYLAEELWKEAHEDLDS